MGNTTQTLTLNVSQLFTRCLDVDLRLQEMFCFLPVCSPMQHCEQYSLKIFLQQCFLVCVGFKDQLSESERQKTKEVTVPCRKLRIAESGLYVIIAEILVNQN